MPRQNVSTANGYDVGLAIKKLFSDSRAVKLTMYGDGSGHTENRQREDVTNFSGWAELGALGRDIPSYVPENMRENYAKFSVGTRVRSTIANGKNGVITYFDLVDGMVKVMYDGEAPIDRWTPCGTLEVISQSAPASIFAAGFAKFPIGSRVEVTAGGRVGEKGKVVAHDENDGMLRLLYDGGTWGWKQPANAKLIPAHDFKLKDDVIIRDDGSMHDGEKAWIVAFKGEDEAVVMPLCNMLSTFKLSDLTKA